MGVERRRVNAIIGNDYEDWSTVALADPIPKWLRWMANVISPVRTLPRIELTPT